MYEKTSLHGKGESPYRLQALLEIMGGLAQVAALNQGVGGIGGRLELAIDAKKVVTLQHFVLTRIIWLISNATSATKRVIMQIDASEKWIQCIQ